MRNNFALKLENIGKRCIRPSSTNKRIRSLRGKLQPGLARSKYKVEYKRQIEDHNLQWMNNHKSYNIFNNSYEI